MNTIVLFSLILVSAVAAGMVQSVAGFGSGIVLSLAFSRIFGIDVAPVLNTSICIYLTATLTWRYRKSVQWRKIVLPLVPYILFSVGSILLIRWLNLRVLGILYGCFLLFLAVFYLFLSKRIRVKPTVPTAVFCGGISGVFSGLFGVGGPILALYLLETASTRIQYIADSQCIFTIINICNMITRIANGMYTAELLPYTAVGILGISVGRRLGLSFAEKIDQDNFKRIIYCIVGISGIITLSRYL